MPRMIWVEDLNKYIEVPDDMSNEEIERALKERISGGGVEIAKSVAHGVKAGAADLVDAFADYSEFGNKFTPVGIMNEVGQRLGAPDISWGRRFSGIRFVARPQTYRLTRMNSSPRKGMPRRLLPV